MMLKKLRLKLVCINMVFWMGLLCVVLGLIVQSTRSNLEHESLRMMQAAAVRPIGPDRPGSPPEEVRIPYFLVRMDRRGGFTATGGGYYDLTDEELLRTLVSAALSSGETSGVLEEYHLRFLVDPQCVVFADTSSELAALGHLSRVCIFAGGLGFLAFLLISVFLSRWAVKPVEQAWAQQKQFVADASHELKTPLTVIMTNAELLNSPACAAADRRQFAQNILTMSQQMRGLAESLLELARADGGLDGAAFSKVDFSALVSDALLPFEAVFFEKGLRLTEEVEPGIAVQGSSAHLKQVLDIFLDNAQKYSAPGGETAVSLHRRGRARCRLAVSNPGETLSREDLENIFKRFYRLDRARSMNHSYGLGLSIARSIVQKHRGKIWAESAGGVNTFFAELPTA